MSPRPSEPRIPRPGRVVSGGQTGVDRAALDAAMRAGLPVGGWCPAGRRAEDGSVPAAYPLRETASASYTERTRLNVRDSDATLILAAEPLTGGTALTVATAAALRRPLLILDPAGEPGGLHARYIEWMRAHDPTTLNVAGPRDDPEGCIYKTSYGLLLSWWG